MSPNVLAVLTILTAYLIGGVPFSYLIVRWRKGIDIRTVGSGNVGATNAGRLLGFRYFVLCFALDFLKGFLPTWGLPWIARELSGREMPALPVLVAVAAILGHNFPVYLGFRGGKGVATSLGAFSALDPIAGGLAVVGFVLALLATRYVSLSSIVGGLAFAAAHFVRASRPWSGRELPLSLAILGLLAMLIVRHRKNYARIAAGTEPKVQLLGRGRRSGETVP